MSGAIPPLPKYAFMAWCLVKEKSTGTTLPLPFYKKIVLSNVGIVFHFIGTVELRIITEF
jgi:hypothetical protein